MQIYALDDSFRLVAVAIPYDNLQWNRRYYEAGEFQLKLSIKVYDPTWAYIGTNERPELGMIQKVQITGEGDVEVLLSGFFCEKMLDDRVIYPAFSYEKDVTSPLEPGIGKFAHFVFNKFGGGLPIRGGVDADFFRGDVEAFTAQDEQLGEKLYAFLESHELSYRVSLNRADDVLEFTVWGGKDRTQSQSVNPYQVFSTDFGNIVSKSVDLDESGYKNYAIIPVMADDDGIEEETYIIDWTNGEKRREIVFDMRSSFPDEYTTDADFKKQTIQECTERLQEYARVEDIDVQPADNSGYMRDYDLGDRCDVQLPDIGVSMETRIVQVDEVFKAGTGTESGHTITIGLGNKRLDNIRRAVRRK